LQEQCSTGPAVRHPHGRDISPYDTMPPDCIIIADRGDPAEMEEAERLNRRVMRHALALDGTCTGEHGVGMHKISLLGEEFGDAAVDLMRRLKTAWDPLNILNPGKVVMTT
jgi:D-lactate dehydrogenase (cytochrome)